MFAAAVVNEKKITMLSLLMMTLNLNLNRGDGADDDDEYWDQPFYVYF